MPIDAQIKENVPLKDLTTFKIGGPARYFVAVKAKDELLAAAEWADARGLPLKVLGGGSNVLVPDEGVSGLTIKLADDHARVDGERIDCGAGAELVRVGRLAAANNLSGLEWAAGIPRATIGGAIRGNAEAFGTAMSDLVETIGVFDTHARQFTIMNKADCAFSYRQSVFKGQTRYIIFSASLKLLPDLPDEISRRIGEAIAFRTSRYPKLPGAGSIFRNVPLAAVRERNPELYGDLRAKTDIRVGNVGAGAIIDIAGLKGKRVGGAMVSHEHANHLVNTGTATAQDVVALISLIKIKIRDEFGLELVEEVEYF